MAKLSKSQAFKSAVISKEDMTITEFLKDETKTYDLMKLIEAWDGVEGISLTIKQDSELPSEDDE